MRHSVRALIGVMLVGWTCCPAMAAETGRKWWQFGKGGEAEVAVPPQTAQAPPATAAPPVQREATLPQYSSVQEPEPRWMISSPLAKVSWPRLHMPELPKPKLPAAAEQPKSEATPSRNAWAEPQTDPLKPSPMHRFGQSTRAAWDKTVDALTPGDQSKPAGPSSRVARRDDRSMWQKMFGPDDPKKKEGSQTIGEFIAQERIDP